MKIGGDVGPIKLEYVNAGNATIVNARADICT